MSKKPQPYVYGKSANPKSWAEAADILKTIKPSKKKGSSLMDRLDAIEKLLRDK